MWRSLVFAGSLAVVAAPTGAWSEILKKEPAMGALKEGQSVYVDDGSCPAGKVMLVTGGNHVKAGGTKQIERSRRCVPRPK
jgi:hypothetical protein